MSDYWISLSAIADLNMGETIIGSDCDGTGTPIYSADTGSGPWNYSSKVRRKHKEGTIIVGARGSIGHPRMPSGEFASTQTTITIAPDQNKIRPKYLLWALRRLDFRSLSFQQAVPMLTVGDFGRASIFVFPKIEQRLIAHILDTLDTQIQQTEALIAKLEKVKEGLLHDLLTRGIDENGQLRPSPEQAPELYKDSPLGLIPKEWESQSLGDIAKILHGYAFEGEFFSDKPEGKLLLTPGNFHRSGGLYFEDSNSKWFTGKIPPGYVLRGGDAATVMTDLSPKALILGRAVVLKKHEELLHNQRIGKLCLRDQAAHHINFLVLIINSQKFRRQVIAEATGTTVRHTSPERMMAVTIALPPKEEQFRIESVYLAFETNISVEKLALQKLKLEKNSLMDDLLIGRVRVTPLLDQAEATTPA